MAAFPHYHLHRNSSLDSTVVPAMSPFVDGKKPIINTAATFSDHPHSPFMGGEPATSTMVKKRKKVEFEKEEENVEEKKGKGEKKRKKKEVIKAVPSGCVHVRARRGEATDSHSLAERARREKISERMKLLQSLVPGCDKVCGKTLILDEIINYVKSLQNQVEFLVTKLASISPTLIGFEANLNSDTLLSQNYFGSEAQLPSLLKSNSGQHTSVVETTTSPSFSLQQDHLSTVISENDGILLWNMDDEEKRLLNQFAFSNLYSF